MVLAIIPWWRRVGRRAASAIRAGTRPGRARQFLQLVALALVAQAASGCARIEPGQVGVKTVFVPKLIGGGIQERPYENGYVLNFPLVMRVDVYDARRSTRKLGGRIIPDPNLSAQDQAARAGMLQFNSSDGQKVWAELLVDYAIDPKQAWQLHQRLGPEFFTQVLEPAAVNAARIVFAAYRAEDLFVGENVRKIQREINDRLQEESIAMVGIRIYEVIINELLFLPEFQAKIEEAMVQTQALRVESQRNQVIKIQNENLRSRAEGEANAMREAAKGRADSVRFEAEARRQANLVEAEFLAKKSLALGGGANVAAFELAQRISDKLRIYGVPTGGGGGTGDGLAGTLALYNMIGIQGSQYMTALDPTAPTEESLSSLSYSPAPATPTPSYSAPSFGAAPQIPPLGTAGGVPYTPVPIPTIAVPTPVPFGAQTPASGPPDMIPGQGGSNGPQGR